MVSSQANDPLPDHIIEALKKHGYEVKLREDIPRVAKCPTNENCERFYVHCTLCGYIWVKLGKFDP